jgi:UDP-3-O-[3-hydroxymyristoyl] glucosamine N-acyltransferase
MANESLTFTLGQIAEKIGGVVIGDPEIVIDSPATSKTQNSRGLAFAESDAYLREAEQSLAAAIIVPESVSASSKALIQHPNPRMAFGHVLHLFDRPISLDAGISPLASVSIGATIDTTVSIGPFAVICDGAQLGANVQVFPFAYIGPNCRIGSGSIVFPHAVLLQNVITGANCKIGPGAILGNSGFGYYWNGSEQVPIPQVGGVYLGDKVDIGALTAIDRATADFTIVQDGVKTDNLVQIAHNVNLGSHSVLASQVGIAGSTSIGARFVAGGQSGVSDHLEIAEGVSIGGRAAVLGSISEPGVYSGFPAIPMSKFRRNAAVAQDLHDLLKRVRSLEKKVAELESGQ